MPGLWMEMASENPVCAPPLCQVQDPVLEPAEAWSRVMSNHVIYDRIWGSRKLARCTLKAALAYPWIYLLADEWGRFELAPKRLWGIAFGAREDVKLRTFVSWLDEYVAVGLLKRYEIDGVTICEWTNFVGPPPSKRRQATLPSESGEIETEGLRPVSRFQAGTAMERSKQRRCSNQAAVSVPSGSALGSLEKEEEEPESEANQEEPPAPSAPSPVCPVCGDTDPECLKCHRPTDLELFIKVFNAAYGRHVTTPGLNGAEEKSCRNLLRTYGREATCCLPLLGWRFDVQGENVDERLRKRVASHLFRDGSRGASGFGWTSLLQRADVIPQDGRLKRIWDIAEDFGIQSGLEKLGVPRPEEPPEPEVLVAPKPLPSSEERLRQIRADELTKLDAEIAAEGQDHVAEE